MAAVRLASPSNAFAARATFPASLVPSGSPNFIPIQG